VRLRLDLSYDGLGFHGWARQPDLRTVQAEVELALDTVLRTSGSALTVAGRTDTGVHARGQVAHVDVPADGVAPDTGRRHEPALDALRRRLNGVLDRDIRVRRVTEAPEGFDARFSAIWRRYAYRIADRPDLVDPLRRGHVLTWSRQLDLDAMNEASENLLGEHDFAAFCRKRAGATTIRSLLDLHWERDPNGLAVGTVRADAFCHNMVRALVGCLIAVGESRREGGWAAAVLAGRQRDPAVRVARPHGLTLEEVGYPAEAELASRARASRTMRTLSTPTGTATDPAAG
jgi:tRNA pseudouridine38-40 synthase